MITYELAKELRDAGYPQDEGDGYFEYGEEKQIVTKKQMDDFAKNPIGMLQITDVESYYVPTLSELIEACGEKYFSLYFDMSDNTWRAKKNDYLGSGESTETAVANLWLELNKK